MKLIGVSAMYTGSGKTAVTCALLNHFERSIQIKIGPDYIDPIIESAISGKHGYNLDKWLQGNMLPMVMGQASTRAEIGIVEGVMGMYDSGIGKEYSTISYFRRLGIKYVLVVDMQKSAESIYYAAKGFVKTNCAGVILNKYMGEKHLKMVEDVFREHGVPVVGRIPFNPELHIEERHLGLSIDSGKERMKEIGSKIEQYIDFSFADNIEDVNFDPVYPEPYNGGRRAAVAMDEAFRFYYETSFDFLKSNFKVEFFSPLSDEIPYEPDLIYLGGGYPELFPEKLQHSQKTKEFLRDYSGNGGMIYSECGGTMYLLDTLRVDEKEYEMSGVLNGKSWMEKRPILNYTRLEAFSNNPIFKKGKFVNGHEFHYGRIKTEEKFSMKVHRGTGIDGLDGITKNNVLGMYTHIDLFRYRNDFISHFK